MLERRVEPLKHVVMSQIVRALLAVLLIGCAAKPAGVERCPGGAAVAASPFCVSRKDATATFCDRRAIPDGGACVPPPPCAPGEVRDLAKNTCVSVLSTTGNREILDVGTWTRLLIGPDGGDASGYLCPAIAKDPAVFGVPPHVLRFTVNLTIPNNELANVRAAVSGIEPSAARVIDGAIEALVQPLRTSGAISNAASATATVRCRIR